MTKDKLPAPRDFLPLQKEVLNAIMLFKYILYSGAFGAGKTLLMCHVAIQTCINHKRVLGLFGAQTYPMLRDTVIRTFLNEIDLYQDVLKKHNINIKLEKKYRPSQHSFQFFNDSEILFRSCDKPSKFKSLNLDFFILDEPVDIPEDVFLMLQGRLRAQNIKKENGKSHRFGAMAGNPSGKMNWVYQRFFEHPTDDYYKVHTRTKDNTFLPNDYIQSMYDAYDFEYARRFLEGKWGSFIGLVYKDFDYSKHVGNFQDKEFEYYIAGVDVGFTNPTAMIAIGIDERNRAYIVKEFYKNRQTTDATVEEMLGWNKRYNFRRIFVDPSAADWIEKAKNLHLRVKEGDNDIDRGIAKCKSFFANDFVFIDNSCENFLKELESYQYDKDNPHGNKTEKPMKKDDHLMDAMRYGFTEHNPWRKKRDIKGWNW